MAGALPRLNREVGRKRAMEMALTGRDVGATEAREWGLVNAVADRDGDGLGPGEGGVLAMAVKWAETIVGNSPDSVVVSKVGVDLAWETGSVEEATQKLLDSAWKGLEKGENVKEGLRAFVEKRRPDWVNSKL